MWLSEKSNKDIISDANEKTAGIVHLMSLPVGCLIPLKIFLSPTYRRWHRGKLALFPLHINKINSLHLKHHKSSLEEFSRAKLIIYIDQKFYPESREKVNFTDPLEQQEIGSSLAMEEAAHTHGCSAVLSTCSFRKAVRADYFCEKQQILMVNVMCSTTSLRTHSVHTYLKADGVPDTCRCMPTRTDLTQPIHLC